MVAIFADSNRARIRYIKEGTSTWGELPGSGATRELRYKSSSITAHKNTVISDEIRADRMVPDHIEVGATSTGDVAYEFSAGSHDDFLESFMYGAWTRPMTFDSVTGDSVSWGSTSKVYISGQDVSDYFTSGRRIRTNGFLTPANNDYFQISAVSFNGGANRTEITVTTTTSVIEAGNSAASVFDANDVVLLKSTVVRFGTAGASTIDSNGGNAFAAAIAAGQLVPGQKIFVEGLGRESGTVTFGANPGVGTRLSISDGAKTVLFQFGGSGGNSVIVVTIGGTPSQTATALVAAINQARLDGRLDCTATAVSAAVTIKNQFVTGGSITETVSDPHLYVVNFSGGDATVRGLFQLISVTDDILTVSPQPSTNANAGSAPITIKGSMLRNPSDPTDIVPQSYTIETGFEDVGQFFLTRGLRVGTFGFTFTANQILEATFAFQGAASTRQITSALGNSATFTVLNTTSTPVMNSTVNVGYVKVNDQQLTTAIQSITLNGNNNLRDQNAVSFKFPAGIGAGRMEISGALTAYFADGALWDKFINHDTLSVEFNTIDVSNNRYEFTIPAVIFSNDGVSPNGINQDVMENLEFQAKRDPVTNCQIQIDRFSSTYPPTA